MRTWFVMLAFLSLVACQHASGFGYEVLLTNLEHLRNEQNNAGEKIAQNISLLTNNIYGLPACPDITKVSGVYNLRPHLSTIGPFPVYCEFSTTYGAGWILLQRRFNGELSFDRTWTQYRNGFGSLQDEFWLGLEKMHQITRSGSYEALVVLRGENGTDYDAKYSQFTIGSEFERSNGNLLYMMVQTLSRIRYTLNFGNYIEGSASDELEVHNGQKFSTMDLNSVNNGCAKSYKSGWWFKNCHNGNLNIPFQDRKLDPKPVWFNMRNKTEYFTAVWLMIRAVDVY